MSEEDDLFGDEAEVGSDHVRQLSDQDLDSGDDEGRNDRVVDEMEEDDPVAERPLQVMDLSLGRPTAPQPSDGEVSL